jgi:hypothetical protein
MQKSPKIFLKIPSKIVEKIDFLEKITLLNSLFTDIYKKL